ncbi:uncharacterized protein LTR77_004469 [Saxophila tyrrhenica]|uniref:SET domain-containing protein n=1 Tax=Saxophila tyrrhenica TaxID=1690608 RepID=A0AAV9PG12_9PEZI|nr:hypothetical protein LTR77_004469 [Saxophila tyrrhenica]
MSTPTATEVKLDRFPHLYIKLDTPKGRGVFSNTPVPPGTILDICPVLLLSPAETVHHIAHTTMNHYTYNWPLRTTKNTPSSNAKTQAVVLGLGSMFNHSRSHQNVVWERDLERQVIVYRTSRWVEEGEELCISYGDRLTFEDAEERADGVQSDEDEVLDKIDLGAFS